MDYPPGLELTVRGPLVLLFYDGFELRARPGMMGATYSQARRLARFVYRTARRRQVRTGFYTAFLSLRQSLQAIGCNVRVNDFAAARRRPDYPIGVCGYPGALEAGCFSNPVIFGHGDLGTPEQAAQRVQSHNIQIVIQPGEWSREYNRAHLGDRVAVLPVGIDVARWSLPPLEKDIDFLIYDKIHWHRDVQVPAVLDRITSELKARGLTYQVLRYGQHIQSAYRASLARSHALLFLCQHETQGIAYQEAMAAGLPVLAWNEGRMIDPNQLRFGSDLKVSSVPYFDQRCGLTFTTQDFEAKLTSFMAKRDDFRPRDFVKEHLSMERAGRSYLQLYATLTKAAGSADLVPGAQRTAKPLATPLPSGSHASRFSHRSCTT